MSAAKVGNQYRWSERNPAAVPGSGVSPTRRVAGMVAYITGEEVRIAETSAPVKPNGNPHRVERWEVTLPDGGEETLAPLRGLDTLTATLGASVATANGRLLKNIQANLPRGLTADERAELARRIASRLANDGTGRVVLWAIHEDKDDHNPHLHIFASARPLKKTKGAYQWNAGHPERTFGKKCAKAYLVRDGHASERWITSAEWSKAKEDGWEKVFTYTDGVDTMKLTQSQAKELDDDWARKSKNPISRRVEVDGWDSRDALVGRRKQWQDVENDFLDEVERRDPTRSLERVDCRSLEARGIDRIPTVHVGTGHESRELAIAENELIRDTNRALARLDRIIARLVALRDLILARIRSTGRAMTRGPILVQAQAKRNPKKYAMLLEDERRARLAAERAATEKDREDHVAAPTTKTEPEAAQQPSAAKRVSKAEPKSTQGRFDEDDFRRAGEQFAAFLESLRRDAAREQARQEQALAIQLAREKAERRAAEATARADEAAKQAARTAARTDERTAVTRRTRPTTPRVEARPIMPSAYDEREVGREVTDAYREATDAYREVEELSERWDDLGDAWDEHDER